MPQAQFSCLHQEPTLPKFGVDRMDNPGIMFRKIYEPGMKTLTIDIHLLKVRSLNIDRKSLDIRWSTLRKNFPSGTCVKLLVGKFPPPIQNLFGTWKTRSRSLISNISRWSRPISMGDGVDFEWFSLIWAKTLTINKQGNLKISPIPHRNRSRSSKYIRYQSSGPCFSCFSRSK